MAYRLGGRIDALVNCAGLQSDRMARASGAAPGARIVPFRGEYYELRRYWLRTGPMVSEMHTYLETASSPALNRAGVTPVGAFTVQFGPESPSIFLLLAHRSIQDFADLDAKLAADERVTWRRPDPSRFITNSSSDVGCHSPSLSSSV